MKLHLLNALLITFLLSFGSSMALADVKFDSFASRPPAKAQGSRSKSPEKTSRSKGTKPIKKKPQPRQKNTKPSKPACSAETGRDDMQQLAVCKDKLQMHYKKSLQQAVSRSRQFAAEQVRNVTLATRKAIIEGEKWAGQCKGEF